MTGDGINNKSSSSQIDTLRLTCVDSGSMNMDAVNELSEILQSEGYYSELIDLLSRAIFRWPDNIDLKLKMGWVHQLTGDFTAAVDCFRGVRQLDKDHVPAFVALAQLRDADLGDCHLLQSSSDLTPQGEIALKHAEARILEQSGRYGESFEAYAAANEWRAKAQGPDIERIIKGAKMVLSDITPDLVARYSGRGNTSAQPIFIVGMPRSGTSLTEQFIDAHPKVKALGEQQIWGQVLSRLVRGASGMGGPMIEAISGLSDHIWISAGDQYLAAFEGLVGSADRTTDKLPGNYGLLPYIRLIFPRAKVLHLRRDPLATLYSCIRQNFRAPALSFTVGDWARQYGVYRALLTAWTPILDGQMMTVDYEDLVTDFPTVARRVVNFLDLEWHEACLYPEQNERLVNTASIFQVREAVHTGSIDAWRRCQTQLEGLLPIIEETEHKLLQFMP